VEIAGLERYRRQGRQAKGEGRFGDAGVLGSREDIFLIFSFFYNVTTSLLSPARVSLSRSLFLGFSLIPVVVVVGVVSSLLFLSRSLCLSGLTSLCLCLCPVCLCLR
jgi:hypothetical protein